MLVSLPAAVQLAGVPLVWFKLVPASNIAFGQKLPGRMAGCCGGAADRSSTSVTPVVAGGPPDTSATRISSALGGAPHARGPPVMPDPAMAALLPALLTGAPEWVWSTTLCRG